MKDDGQTPDELRGNEDVILDEGGEVVSTDDTVIGQAFRVSMLVLVGAAVLAVLFYVFFARETETQGPELEVEAEAPERVVHSEAGDLPAVIFTDMTAAAGIDFTHVNGATGDKLLPETMGSGAAFFDYDNDGDADLLFVNSTAWPFNDSRVPAPTMALYRNRGDGTFEDVTVAAGLDISHYGMGVAVGDIDADGWRDVFVTAVGQNRLLRNRGDGRFEDVTASAGVAGEASEWSTGAGFFDADNDGDLDLFVANYVRWSKDIDFQLDFRLAGVGRAYGPPQSYEGTYPYFYRNLGDGTFEDATAEAGMRVGNAATGVPEAKSLALGIADIDADGWMDLFVANDTVRNFFFHNLGDGTFEEVGEFFGLAYDRDGNATGAMGVDVGHHRNDEHLAFLIGNFANEMSSAYVSQDDPTFFVDESISEGIGAPSRRMLTFGLFLFDADLDGRLDLLQTNGHLEDEIATVDPSQSYRQPAQLFWNTGERFEPVPPELTGALAQDLVGRACSYADIDGDGDLDVVLTQVGGRPLLLRNDQATGHHWLRVRLQGKAPNVDAIGAWVELTVGGVMQRRQVMPTRGYLSQVELPVTFGLGSATQVEALRVHWPDGSQQDVAVEGVDQQVVVEQD